MKRLIIGRADDCDIIIQDPTDTVSRHHLVISIGFTGKMTASDTSANGTTVNGRRLTKGVSLPVRRGDEIRLGDVADLDWDRISDPYSSVRKTVFMTAALLIGVLIGGGVWWYLAEREKEEMRIEIPVNPSAEGNPSEWNKDSTLQVAPVATSIEIGDDGKAKQPSQKKESKSSASSSTRRKKQSSKTVYDNRKNASSPSSAGKPSDKTSSEKMRPLKSNGHEKSERKEMRTTQEPIEKD